MVDFKTRIYTESEDDIIGAEVLVYSDNGDRIGSIEIVNAEDLNDLREQLSVIDETYFTESRLNAILANAQENTDINATELSGFASSDFAKVSQLSNYALSNHTHVKTNISDLYNYSISCSDYNPQIDSDVSVTVKVTNQAGNPVSGQSVSIEKNNESWRNGVTGSNGEFTTTYTCSEWGLVTFSTNNNSIQLNVDGWRRVVGGAESTYKIYRNKTHARLVLSGWYTAGLRTTWYQFGGENYARDCPPMNMANGASTDGVVVFYVNTSGGIYYKATTSDAGSTRTIDAQFEWAIQNGY